MHVSKSKLVLNSKTETSNKNTHPTDVTEKEPDACPSKCNVSPDSETNVSHDTPSTLSHDAEAVESPDCPLPGDGEKTRKALPRTLSEQEEFERLRAKKIVMEAILSEQCKEALKETGVSKGQDSELSCGSSQRPQANKSAEEAQKCIDVNRQLKVSIPDPDKSCGTVQRPHAVKVQQKNVKATIGLDNDHSCGSGHRPESVNGLDETQKCCSDDRLLKVVDVAGNNSNLGPDLGIVKRRVKHARLSDEGIVQTTVAEEEDAEEGGVSVSSRVKRFSLSDDQVEMAQKQSGSSPNSPCPPRATNDIKRMVVKRNDAAEVKQRSVMSVTVTTSEDNATYTHTNGGGVEHSNRPITDETESVVWRVRNRRKLREQANLAKTS